MTPARLAAQNRAVPPLPQQLPLDPQPDFALVLARVRRLAGADNKAIANVLHVTPNFLTRIDNGTTPDYRIGSALIKLLQQVGGNLAGLTIIRR